MKPSLLAWITICLLLLVVGERVGRAVAGADRPAPASVPLASRTPGPVNSPPGGSTVTLPATPAPVLTPDTAAPEPEQPNSAVERLARLAVRRELARTAAGTYLDSLLLTTDSVLRRWPDREGDPLVVAIVPGGADRYRPEMAEDVRRALDLWQAQDIGVSFDVVDDTTGADIVVRWIDHFEFDRAGQTDLTWDQSGRVRRAVIALATTSVAGDPLPDAALRAVALHETGHALGLPHSADSTDVMFPATRTDRLSERDRRSVLVLYHLPPGSVRDLPPDPADR